MKNDTLATSGGASIRPFSLSGKAVRKISDAAKVILLLAALMVACATASTDQVPPAGCETARSGGGGGAGRVCVCLTVSLQEGEAPRLGSNPAGLPDGESNWMKGRAWITEHPSERIAVDIRFQLPEPGVTTSKTACAFADSHETLSTSVAVGEAGWGPFTVIHQRDSEHPAGTAARHFDVLIGDGGHHHDESDGLSTHPRDHELNFSVRER